MFCNRSWCNSNSGSCSSGTAGTSCGNGVGNGSFKGCGNINHGSGISSSDSDRNDIGSGGSSYFKKAP